MRLPPVDGMCGAHNVLPGLAGQGRWRRTNADQRLECNKKPRL
jgi:hypothetical protein